MKVKENFDQHSPGMKIGAELSISSVLGEYEAPPSPDTTVFN